jgi:hypothetical protein
VLSQATDLYILEDLEDVGKTGSLDDTKLEAMRTLAEWIETFIVKPHEELGRAGPVCPFTPEALMRETLWLAPESVAARTVPEIVGLVNEYKDLLLRAEPIQGPDTQYKAILIVLTDLPAVRAREYVDDAQMQRLNEPLYADEGVVLDPKFNETNDGSAIRNPNFHPFRSPVPFFLLRHAVTSDWKFFLDSEDWFSVWAGRFADAAATTLAAELRRTNWRVIDV